MPTEIISEESIRQLINSRTEKANHDFKRAMNWRTIGNAEKWGLVKDALAMANTRDGGRLIIGIERDYSYSNMSEEDQLSFDPTLFNNFYQRYTEPIHTCGVNHLDIDGNRLVVVSVPEFTDTPIICAKDATENRQQYLREGAIYIRHEDASPQELRNAQKTRELMGRAISRRGDTLLREIGQLIGGRPLVPEAARHPYEADSVRLLKFLEANISGQLADNGHMTIVSYPSRYMERRFESREVLKELVKSSQVHLRGWGVPHLDQDNFSNFVNGIQSFTVWHQYIEAFQACLSGFFGFREVLKEDLMPKERQELRLDYLGILLSITEYTYFISRFYASLDVDEQIVIEFMMEQTQGRKLVSTDLFNRPIYGEHICREPSIKCRLIKSVADLRANHKKIAGEIIKEVYNLFNCTQVEDATIEYWQNKLFEQTL